MLRVPVRRQGHSNLLTPFWLPALQIRVCIDVVVCRCVWSARRVANTFSSDADKSQYFNELGVSSAMMHTCCEDTFTDRKSTSHIRCAKRSSAALRTAMLFEERMEEFEVEELNSTGVDCEGLLSNATSESGLASRARRDAKSSLEQRALPLLG